MPLPDEASAIPPLHDDQRDRYQEASIRRQKYQVGSTDQCGRTIEAIFSHYEDYIVYEALEVLQIEGRTDGLNACPELGPLINDAIALSRSRGRRRRGLFFELSGIIDQCMFGNQKDAVNRAKAVLAKVSRRATSTARLHYLWSAVGAVGILWLITSGAILLAPKWSDLIWWEVMSCGATGALFSVMLNQRTIPIDVEDSTLVHWTAGASRAAIGVIAGAICFLAIKSGIALTFAYKAEDFSGIFFFCFLSGFSETFVPNLLKSHDKDADLAAGTLAQKG